MTKYYAFGNVFDSKVGLYLTLTGFTYEECDVCWFAFSLLQCWTTDLNVFVQETYFPYIPAVYGQNLTYFYNSRYILKQS